MNKKQLKKNVLDLKYQFETQKINAILITTSVGILAFIGSFIWYRERFFFGAGLSIIVISVSLFIYRKTKRKMVKILEEISKI